MRDEFVKSIGIWGCGCPADTSAVGRNTDRAGRRDQRHYDYRRKHKPAVINVMRMKGTLEKHLTETDNHAQEMFEKLMKEYADFEGITEQLKADNRMEWVGRMNNIKARVTHVVNCELTFIACPPKRKNDFRLKKVCLKICYKTRARRRFIGYVVYFMMQLWRFGQETGQVEIWEEKSLKPLLFQGFLMCKHDPKGTDLFPVNLHMIIH